MIHTDGRPTIANAPRVMTPLTKAVREAAAVRASVERDTETELLKQAYKAGYAHGVAAGSWVIDGNTTAETARYILAGFRDGDPEVLDLLPSEPLSGEWADGPTPATVLADLGVDEDDALADDLLYEYEAGFASGMEDEVTRSAEAIL